MAVRMHAAEQSIPLQGVVARVRLERPAPDTVTFEHSLEFDGPLGTGHRLQLE